MARFFRPQYLVLVPVLISGLVWLIPWGRGIRTGYTDKEPVTAVGLAVIVAYYGAIALAGGVGYLVGRQVTPNPTLDAADDDRFYKVVTAVAVFGVLATYASAELASPGVVLRSIQELQFNRVRAAIPQAAGISTLRYASIVAGGLAIYDILGHRGWRRPVNLLNLVLLVMSAAIASRLSFLMAIVIGVGLVATRRPGVVRARTVVWGALAVTVVLGAFNYVRNANYYATYYNTSNPLVANLNEVVAYLGSPFQVAMGTGSVRGPSAYPASADVVSGLANVLLPSFGSGGDDGTTALGAGAYWYRGVISIQDNLTTNSSLAALWGQLGIWSIPVMAAVGFLAGLLIGHTLRYRSYLTVVAFVLSYCLLELWRIYIFATGLVVFVLLLTVALCLVVGRTGGRRPAGVAPDRVLARRGPWAAGRDAANSGDTGVRPGTVPTASG